MEHDYNSSTIEIFMRDRFFFVPQAWTINTSNTGYVYVFSISPWTLEEKLVIKLLSILKWYQDREIWEKPERSPQSSTYNNSAPYGSWKLFYQALRLPFRLIKR